MKAKLLKEYKNGNAIVKIYEDGTRVIETEADRFDYERPLNIDVNVSNRCLMGCQFCYNGSHPWGDNAPLRNFMFLDSMFPGSEVSLSTGTLSECPDFEEILKMCAKRGIIDNATFHENEFLNNFALIKSWQDAGLLHGIGISYNHEDDRLVNCVKEVKNVVFHVINGVFTGNDANWLIDNIDHPKVLILGYKMRNRGLLYQANFSDDIKVKQKWLYDNLADLMKKFYVISFDNSALAQLEVKRLLNEDEWNSFYQGSDNNGESGSMYIDAVKGKFARNSISDIQYELTDDVKYMFYMIKNEKVDK